MQGISIEVDRLTDSIEDAKTGASFETTVVRIEQGQSQEIRKSHWLFDWRLELRQSKREVYKLVKVEEPKILQGLLSLEDRGDHVYVYLVESSKHNRGSTKSYIGVPGNLFAFACLRAFELGYDGHVAFDSKTALIEHYKQTLGAIQVRGQRLILDYGVAKKLVFKYFNLEK